MLLVLRVPEEHIFISATQMLLQLPLELQQRVIGCLSTSQALNFREVSRVCRSLASSCIRSASLSSVSDLKKMTESFPCVSQLFLAPETKEDVVLLFESFLPDPLSFFPATLTQLSINSDVGYNALHGYEIDKTIAACPDLHDIRLSAYHVDLTAEDMFLKKLTQVHAVADTDPGYPAACFLGSGILNPSRLSACSNLRSLRTYTRTSDETICLVRHLPDLPRLEDLKLVVPFIQDVVPYLIPPRGGSSTAKRVKITQLRNGGDFIFDLWPFPGVEFLVISLPGPLLEHMPHMLYGHDQPYMLHLKTAWLENVFALTALEHASALTTLGLSYTPGRFLSTERFEGLRSIPQLQRLQICDHDVDIEDLIACPRLQEVVLVDVIGTQAARSVGILQRNTLHLNDITQLLSQTSGRYPLPCTSRTSRAT